jgi:TPP-dependent pyruvate/acetoin dehydrogenase alpha subunit
MEDSVTEEQRPPEAAPRATKSRSNGNGHTDVPAVVKKYTPIEPHPKLKLSRQELVRLFHNLKRVRMFEEALSRMYRQGKILGGVYSGRGQEAISVGTTFLLRGDDVVSPIHRDMGVFLLKGMPMKKLMCQILGRVSGPSRGKDSWSHTGDMKYNILASSSMLASSVPIACGAAMGTQMQGKDSVTVTYFGEGSTARGDYHEGINMAAIYRLPVILICENNQWAYSTPPTREMGDVNMAKRAAAYGMEGYSIDANDILTVVETMRRAIDHARRGDGPTFIECRTYRMSGHSEHDEATYRPKDEINKWEKRDPLGRFREYLVEAIDFSEDEEARMQDEIEREIQEARRFADAEPFPEGHEALEGVYVP